jgi:hypothetical protein
VTGSFTVSLAVSSSSPSSGMGLRRSTGRKSGEEARLAELLELVEDVGRGIFIGLVGTSRSGTEDVKPFRADGACMVKVAMTITRAIC